MELKIQRMGTIKVEVGEGGAPIEFDAIAAWDEWNAQDWTYRDEKGILPVAKLTEWKAARKAFAEAKLSGAKLTFHEADQFFHGLAKRIKELRDFFEEKRSETPSSPESSDPSFAQ